MLHERAGVTDWTLLEILMLCSATEQSYNLGSAGGQYHRLDSKAIKAIMVR